MEDYVATDKRPLERCRSDINRCDLYIGVFAWRYGYIPKADNPEQLSITELEYEHAKNTHRLIFLLDSATAWPAKKMDAIVGRVEDARKIKRLRKQLADDHTVSFFRGPDDLANQANIAVHRELRVQQELMKAEVTEQLRKQSPGEAMNVAPELLAEAADQQSLQFGQTLYPELKEKLTEAIRLAGSARLVEVDLGDGRRWWSTRLHLMAALASDYTAIEQFIFFAEGRRLLGFASTRATRIALARQYPRVELAYRRSYEAHGLDPAVPEVALEATLEHFSMEVGKLAPAGSPPHENLVKEWVSGEMLVGWMGADLSTPAVELRGRSFSQLLAHQVMEQDASFVALVDKGRVVHVVDRTALAVRLTQFFLEQHLDRE